MTDAEEIAGQKPVAGLGVQLAAERAKEQGVSLVGSDGLLCRDHQDGVAGRPGCGDDRTPGYEKGERPAQTGPKLAHSNTDDQVTLLWSSLHRLCGGENRR